MPVLYIALNTIQTIVNKLINLIITIVHYHWFVIGNMNLKFLEGSREDQQMETIKDIDSPSARTTQVKCSEEKFVYEVKT